MKGHLDSPFGREPIDEIALPRAPLVSVVAQLRFPEIAATSLPQFVAPFQEALRPDYPNSDKESGAMFVAEGGNPAQPASTGVLWRFADTTKAWRVSLAPTFVSLDTSRYVSRRDFLVRLGVVLDAVAKHIRPQTYVRLGIRYIDRLDQPDDMQALPQLIRPELLPMLRLDTGTASTRLRQTFSQTEFEHDRAIVRLRSAILPPLHLIDPATLDPLDHESWILDIDMFEHHHPPAVFSAESALARAAGFAQSIYRCFRWVVTEEFLRRMGAHP